MKPSLEERTRQALRQEAPEERVNRMWAGIERRRSPKGWAAGRAVPVGLALAAAVAFVIFAWPRQDGPLALEDGSRLPSHMTPHSSHVFSDGSRVMSEGEVDTLSNVQGEVAFALRSGDVHFDIVPDGPRRWRVVAGAVEVVVVGTVFDVERSGSAVDVRVERGVVLVRGGAVPDGEQRLEAGDTLHVPLVPESDVVDTNAPVENHVAGDEVDESLDENTPLQEATQDVAPAESETAELSLDELLRRGDAARHGQRHEQAVRWLSRAASEYPDQPRAAMAAFTAGRIELESLDRPASAARSFARSLTIGLPMPLRETAQALRAESLGEAGDPRAVAEAERFLARYPRSSYRSQVIEATGVRAESAPESSP